MGSGRGTVCMVSAGDSRHLCRAQCRGVGCLGVIILGAFRPQGTTGAGPWARDALL